MRSAEQQPVLQRVLAALLDLALLQQHQRCERLLGARVSREAVQPQRQPHCEQSSQEEWGEETHGVSAARGTSGNDEGRCRAAHPCARARDPRRRRRRPGGTPVRCSSHLLAIVAVEIVRRHFHRLARLHVFEQHRVALLRLQLAGIEHVEEHHVVPGVRERRHALCSSRSGSQYRSEMIATSPRRLRCSRNLRKQPSRSVFWPGVAVSSA